MAVWKKLSSKLLKHTVHTLASQSIVFVLQVFSSPHVHSIVLSNQIAWSRCCMFVCCLSILPFVMEAFLGVFLFWETVCWWQCGSGTTVAITRRSALCTVPFVRPIYDLSPGPGCIVTSWLFYFSSNHIWRLFHIQKMLTCIPKKKKSTRCVYQLPVQRCTAPLLGPMI